MGREKKRTVESGGGCQVGQGAAGEFRGENRETSFGGCGPIGRLGPRESSIRPDSSASRAPRERATTTRRVGVAYFCVMSAMTAAFYARCEKDAKKEKRITLATMKNYLISNFVRRDIVIFFNFISLDLFTFGSFRFSRKFERR